MVGGEQYVYLDVPDCIWVSDMYTYNFYKAELSSYWDVHTTKTVWRKSRVYDSGPESPGFETCLSHLIFLLGKEIDRHY